MTPETRKAAWKQAQEALAQSRWTDAATVLATLVADDPSDYAAQVNLGASLIQLGRYADAEAQTDAAMAAGHRTPLLWLRRAQLLHAMDRPNEVRRQHALDWLAACPDDIAARVSLAYVERALGHFAEARAHWQAIQQMDRNNLLAAWAWFQFPDAPVSADAEAPERFRRQFDEGLAAFAALRFSNDDTLPRRALDALGSTVPFHLAYLPGSDPERMRLYAQQLRRLALAAGLRDRPAFTRVRRSVPRVVVFSAYLHDHSVSRVWRELLIDGAKGCELIALQAGTIDDASMRRWRQAGVEVIPGNQNVMQWSRVLHRLDPDVVVFLDLGMEPLANALASVRHAPRQYATWAHPYCSGHATIDGFLGSDLAEPADGERHYAEKLIRLPGLASSYRFPGKDDSPAPIPDAGAALDVACLQIGYKLTPDQDAKWAALLELDPRVRLHLTPNLVPVGETLLRQRIGAALGEDRATRVAWHDLMSFDDYCAHIRRMQFIADTEHFSGGVSSADALSLGVPVLTIEGTTMRARQTTAMLRLLDLPELVCHDRAQWLATARRLLTDRAWHQSLRDRLVANRVRLHGHAEAATALNDLLHRRR